MAVAEARSAPQLTDPHPCPQAPGFTCSTLKVPLDHTGADNADAPRGVLLILTGGPGLPGVPLAGQFPQLLPESAKNYRIVMLDQRGTGELGAINCPRLHDESRSSDVAPPSAQAVTECAAIVGPNRRFYRTDDTVADLDLLRRALGAEAMTLNGSSYGTFSAARYALATPAT